MADATNRLLTTARATIPQRCKEVDTLVGGLGNDACLKMKQIHSHWATGEVMW
jgi:hypothetical protein